MTDTHDVYMRLRDSFARHEAVNHVRNEYVREEADGTKSHTQTVESFNEVAFRWTHKNVSDGERTNVAIRQCEGRRLTYRELAALDDAA